MASERRVGFSVPASRFGAGTAFVPAAVGSCLVVGCAAALWDPVLAVALVVAPLSLAVLVKYPEVGLVFYATCLGFLDPLSELLGIPSGYRSLLVSIPLVLALAFLVLRKRGRIVSLGVMHLAALCLGAVLFVGLLWTPSPGYGQDKLERYVFFNLLLLLGVSLVGDEISRLRRMMYAAAFLGVAFCVWGLIAVFLQHSDTWSRLALGTFDPIWLARGLGIFVISLVVLGQVSKTAPARGMIWLTAAVLILLMFHTGSRGPVYALLLTLLLCFLFLSGRPIRERLLVTGVGAVVVVCILSIVPGAAESRLLQPVDRATVSAAFSDRLPLWREAIDLLRSYPIRGVGTGGYSYSLLGLDARAYPHNLFLEVACELGVIGIVPLLVFLFAGVRTAAAILSRREGITNDSLPAVWGVCIFVFAFINAMVSGDMVGNAVLWLSTGFMWCAYVTFKKA